MLSVDHALESHCKYRTTIYQYFCIGILSKKIMKICFKMHHLKKLHCEYAPEPLTA